MSLVKRQTVELAIGNTVLFAHGGEVGLGEIVDFDDWRRAAAVRICGCDTIVHVPASRMVQVDTVGAERILDVPFDPPGV